MSRTKKRQTTNPKLEMTPMIDVVFLLLIYFIVTLVPEDILAHLDVTRPAPESMKEKPEEKIEKLLEIMVYKDGFVMNGRAITRQRLDRKLGRLAALSRNISVIIKCTEDSPHMYLVELLDICAKNKLTQLSVFSMNKTR